MYISDIAVDTVIKIEIRVGTKDCLTFETKAVAVDDKALNKLRSRLISVVAEPVKKDDKIIALRMGTGIVYSVQAFNAEEEKMYEWKNVKPQMTALKSGEKYLLLCCQENAKPLNRRRHFRIWLGIEAVATFGSSREPVDLIVKDISSSGIALIVKNLDKEVWPNTLIHVTFFDEDTETNFNISALAVRTEVLDETRTMIACKLNAESPVINKYIREKERANLKKHSNRYSEKRQQDFTG